MIDNGSPLSWCWGRLPNNEHVDPLLREVDQLVNRIFGFSVNRQLNVSALFVDGNIVLAGNLKGSVLKDVKIRVTFSPILNDLVAVYE